MYKIFKGVQKPIMFKGFKGKYIYMAGGVLGVGLLCLVFLSSALGFLLSLLIGGGIGTVGIITILRKQSKGLYTKDKTKGIFIVKNRLTKF